MRCVVTLGIVLVSTAGCLDMGASHDVVRRVTCPSVPVDAVLVETNGGATTSFGYEVHLVPRGQKPSQGSEVAFLYGAVRNSNAYGANLRWTSGDTLAVEVLEARKIVRHKPSAQLGSADFHIQLVPGVEDTSAPAGGMLYNLERANQSK
jgi:hypothetical protein